MSRTSGPSDLLVHVDRGLAVPLRDQIAGQLRSAIRSGRLREGVRLPATRTLAEQLGVSRGVVVEAYDELRQQGFLAVAGRTVPRVAAAAAEGGGRPHPEPRVVRFDLSPETPDLAMFPRREWSRALQRAIRSAPDRAFGYGDPRGEPALRRALADYLGRARGVIADPEHVVVCQGSIQAVDLACRLVAAAGGRTLAVEDPCTEGVRAAGRAAGLEVRPVPVDAAGLDVGRLGAADAVVVSPVHQFPSAVALAEPRRAALVEWARGRGSVVVEDDYDAEHHYGRRPPAALQGSAPDRIVYVGSASKALAPAIRLGWAVLPPALAAQAGELKAALDGGSPAPEQLALAEMIDSAAFERHLRRSRAEYSRRRDALLAALARWLPDGEVGGGPAGLHLTVRLPEPFDRAALERNAAAARIRLHVLEAWLADPPGRARTLVIGYGRLPAAATGAAVRAIAGLVLDRPAAGAVALSRPVAAPVA